MRTGVPLRGRTIAALAAAVMLALAAAGAGGEAAHATAAAPSAGACGAATQSVLATADGEVTTDIYDNELSGGEVDEDVQHVTSDMALVSAVAADSVKATLAAVEKLIYHPGWHIVRLVVDDARGRQLVTYGGRYVIAPVDGVLRSASGATVGSFVMSVQDDIGVTKLETRFVGDPIGFYLRGELVASLGGPAFPTLQPRGPWLTIAGRRYYALTLTYEAAPSGTLHAVLLVGRPPAALAAESCGAIRAGEFGRVAMRLTHLLGPLAQHWYGYAYWVHIYTGAAVFVRSPDGTQLASSDGSDPPSLPASGTLSYEGQSWLVYSFDPLPPTLVYLLVPAS
jgi:hypothetical protein